MCESEETTLVVITRGLPSASPGNCDMYEGVTELAGVGVTLITVIIPFGVKPFPHVPCYIRVPTYDTFAEFDKHNRAFLTVNRWYPQ